VTTAHPAGRSHRRPGRGRTARPDDRRRAAADGDRRAAGTARIAALHRPFVAMNDEIVRTYEAGDAGRAAQILRDHQPTSERVVPGARP
jgi:hypothetical protein